MPTNRPTFVRPALVLAVALSCAGAWAQSSGSSGSTGSQGSGSSSGMGTGAPATTPAAPKTANPGTAADNRTARADSGFMKQAAQNGFMEIEASKLALTKASNPQVKDFAQKMIDDHTKAGNELKTLAQSKGVTLPTEASVMQKGKLKLLNTADGAKFDQRYADEAGVKAHEDTVKMFRKASTDARDPEVKAFASKMLPALEMHLDMARKLKTTVDGSGNSANKG